MYFLKNKNYYSNSGNFILGLEKTKGEFCVKNIQYFFIEKQLKSSSNSLDQLILREVYSLRAFMTKYPHSLQSLILFFRKLPGVGAKTAERYAFQMLDWSHKSAEEFANTIKDFKTTVIPCHECGCITEKSKCFFCEDPSRNTSLLCIVSSSKDVYPIEDTRVFKGLYHVIGRLLSPVAKINPTDLDIDKIKNRIIKHQINDVLLALDSTLEGEATALYLKEQIQQWGVNVTRPAMGMPMGSSLDFIDPGTLTHALLGRHFF